MTTLSNIGVRHRRPRSGRMEASLWLYVGAGLTAALIALAATAFGGWGRGGLPMENSWQSIGPTSEIIGGVDVPWLPSNDAAPEVISI